jgi:membrane fusion protein, copper/silver efflux system
MKPFLLILLVCAAVFGGWWFGRHGQPRPGAGGGAAGARKVAFYQSPMHPWIKSDQPGRCTICGMELSPVYEGESGFAADTNVVSLSKNGVTVTGVETATVKRQPIQRAIRVSGMIDDDDSAHRRLSATADGRVEKLFVNYVGAEVEAGQPLATLYSPALRTVFSEYQLIAQQAASAQRTQLLAGIRERLLRLGLSENDIAASAGSDKVPLEIKVLAPMTGTVVARNVYEGQYVKEGDMLFEVGDFSKMWFVFDAYERDIQWIKVGVDVEITTPALPGRVLKAPIAFIDPNLNPETRSAKIRVVLENPLSKEPGKHRHELLHKLYAEGRILTESAPTLTVPRSAVLWPAGKPMVYLVKGEGVYEPREVQVGGAGDAVWEIAGGLSEGDQVVTTGNLLLDGQAQINRPPDKPATALKQTLTEPQRQAALDFFAVVAELGGTLAADKPAAFKEAAAKLPPVVGRLAKELGDRARKVVEVANLPASGDLAAQRAAFYPLGEAAAELALALRREDSGLTSVKVFACDMAQGNVPSAPKERGHWIQLSSQLRNPWWGAEMLECGAEIKP